MARNLITLQKRIQVRSALFVIVLYLLAVPAFGQTDTGAVKNDTLPADWFKLHSIERNGESLPEVNIKEVVIVGRPGKSRKLSYNKYQRLIYNLKKVYPYSLIVKNKMADVNYELEKIPDDKGRRKYLKQVEKEVFSEYEDDVRGMTITQGRLLLKLIDRETQNTSYSLIRQYRGGVSAAFWQGIARIFGTNLKDEYDPYGDDAVTEMIVLEIEAGNL